MCACSGSAGYQGYLKCNGFLLPYLGADLAEVTELYISNSIHGGGTGNTNPVFRSQANYSIGRQSVEGNINLEVFAGTGKYAQGFTELLKRAIPTQTDDTFVCNGFNTAAPLIFSPGGGSEIVVPSALAAQGKALVASMEIRGNPGGNVQCNARIIGAGADYNNTNLNVPQATDLAFESPGNSDDSNPVPYYASNFTVTGSGESNLTDRITDWNISINNNCVPIFAFDGKNYAQDIILGMMEVTGSFTYYSPTGTFVLLLTHGAVGTITFGSTTITIPFMAFEKMPTPPSPGPNNPTVRTINFRGMAASSNQPAIFHN